MQTEIKNPSYKNKKPVIFPKILNVVVIDGVWIFRVIQDQKN